LVEVLSSYIEELSEDDDRQEEEMNVGLVIDGEVCKHLPCQQLMCLCRHHFYTLLIVTVIVYFFINSMNDIGCRLNFIISYSSPAV